MAKVSGLITCTNNYAIKVERYTLTLSIIKKLTFYRITFDIELASKGTHHFKSMYRRRYKRYIGILANGSIIKMLVFKFENLTS